MRFFNPILVLSISFFGTDAIANTSSLQVDSQSLSLQKSYLQTIDCRSPKKLAGLISQALKNAEKYTVKANNAVVLEEIMMNNPSCFIQAVNNLPSKQCSKVEETLINETFFYPRHDIKRALESATNYSKSCIASSLS